MPIYFAPNYFYLLLSPWWGQWYPPAPDFLDPPRLPPPIIHPPRPPKPIRDPFPSLPPVIPTPSPPTSYSDTHAPHVHCCLIPGRPHTGLAPPCRCLILFAPVFDPQYKQTAEAQGTQGNN